MRGSREPRRVLGQGSCLSRSLEAYDRLGKEVSSREQSTQAKRDMAGGRHCSPEHGQAHTSAGGKWTGGKTLLSLVFQFVHSNDIFTLPIHTSNSLYREAREEDEGSVQVGEDQA